MASAITWAVNLQMGPLGNTFVMSIYQLGYCTAEPAEG